ncbi:MAG: hypothetical protein QM733_17760 [Ilumatobacteraceae bacterium]
MSAVDPWVRNTWHLLEHVNAVSYFAPECREAPDALGLRGFWAGYFACRAAPFGAVGPAVVEATFFNFSPARVRATLPDAWTVATPDAVLAARRASAAAALRRLVPDIERDAGRLAGMLEPLVAAASPHGRPLFAANQALPVADDPVERLWQACTTTREHRGDGHVAALVAADLDGCEALVLFGADERNPPGDLLRESRGWSTEEWAAAAARLVGRGLLDDGERLTDVGVALRADIEAATDVAAARLFVDLAVTREELTALAGPIARSLRDSSTITYPNPMGLPPAT